jgi:hypothetical protein
MKNNETAEWLQSEANNGWTSGYSHITGVGGRKSIGEYPTYEEYLNVHSNETAYVNKLRRPANIKSTAVNIVVAVLIFAPALVGIFYVGSHMFNSITGGNNEANPQVTTSAPANTPTETQTPTPTGTATSEATRTTQTRPEPYVNKEGHTVYPAVEDSTVEKKFSETMSNFLSWAVGFLPYLLGFIVLWFVIGLLLE